MTGYRPLRALRRLPGLVLAAWAALAAPGTAHASTAKAESFRLDRGETLYACNTQTVMQRMLKAATLPDYVEAVARISAYEHSACPKAGPFRSNRLHARVVIDEPGRLVGGYTRIVMVEWRFSGSDRLHRSLMVRAADGRWHDAIDVMMERRTAYGILDFLLAK